MLVDMSQKIYDVWGKPYIGKNTITNEEGESEVVEEVLTLGVVCVTGMLTILESERISGQEKSRRYSLASLIANNMDQGEVDLSSTQIMLLRETIGNVYNVAITGAVWEMLDEVMPVHEVTALPDPNQSVS